MAPSDDSDGWTVLTLKAHFEQRFADQEKAVSAALASAEKAVAAALAAAEKAREQAQADAMAWRASANEWRGSMLDREQKFASRSEAEAEHKTLRAEIQGLRESRAISSGADVGERRVIDTSRSNVMVVVSVVGGIVGLLGLGLVLARMLMGK